MSDAGARLDELIASATIGNRQSLETLLLHFHDPLLRFIQATIRGGNAGGISAEDLLQESLIEAFRQIKMLKPQGSDAFFGWLKTIAVTRHINMLKAAKAIKRGGGKQAVTGQDPNATATAMINLLVSAGPSPSRVIRRKEAIGAMNEAMKSLDADRQEVLNLRYGQGLSVQDVADRTGKSLGAIKMLIHRAVIELRERFGRDFGEFSVEG